MTGVINIRETCRLCQSTSLHCVLSLAPSPPADAFVVPAKAHLAQPCYPLDVYWCADCFHVQLLQAIDPQVLFRDYIYTTTSSPGLTAHFKAYAESVVATHGIPAGSLVVDIGSNDGTLLRFFKQMGMTVVGVDPALEIARQATAAGLETIADFFTSELAATCAEERGAAGLITANNVFAHSDDLGDMADGVCRWLAPDGIFVFEVQYLADMLDHMVFDYIYHEHLSYHSVEPLQRFLAVHGLELIHVRDIPTKGGSLRAVAQRAGGPRPVDASVAAHIARERESGLHRLATFRRFADRVETLRSANRRVLSDLTDNGKRVVGFGACATATTLIHHFGLQDYVTCILDDNPDRQGTLSPGLHLPVRSPQVLHDGGADVAVILAWRFAEPIMRRHCAFLEHGTFVIPLPALQVVETLSAME